MLIDLSDTEVEHLLVCMDTRYSEGCSIDWNLYEKLEDFLKDYDDGIPCPHCNKMPNCE